MPFAAGDGAEELGDLDRLEIVETQLVSRRDAEQAVGMVLRAGLDAREAVVPRVCPRPVEQQLVHPLLAEGERPLGAGQLEAELHLPAGRDPVRFDGPAAASGEAHAEPGDVVDLDRPAVGGAGRHRTRPDHRLEIGDDLADRPDQEARQADDVTADVGDGAAATAGVHAPAIGYLGIGHVVLGVNTAKARDVAELARRDHRARELQDRVPEVVVADLRHDLGRFGRFHHVARRRRVRRDRLLAMDMLAGGDGGQRHLTMDDVRRGDRDDLDLGILDEAPPIGTPAGKAQLAGGPFRCRPVDVGHTLQNRAQAAGKDAGDRPVGERMSLAHEAGADDPDPDATHDGCPPSFARPRRAAGCFAKKVPAGRRQGQSLGGSARP